MVVSIEHLSMFSTVCDLCRTYLPERATRLALDDVLKTFHEWSILATGFGTWLNHGAAITATAASA